MGSRAVRRRLALCLPLLLLSTAAPARVEPAKPIRLVTVVLASAPVYAKMGALLDAIFARLKMSYVLESQPGERAVASFKNGEFDGDVGRSAVFSQTFPEAIRVDPSLGAYSFIAISANAAIAPKSWEEAAKYRVAFRRGYKEIEARMEKAPYQSRVNAEDACVGMVKHGRADICLANALQFENSPLLTDPDLHVSVVATAETFIFLGPQHQDLALRMGKVLAAMRKEMSANGVPKEMR
ncbi:MAG: hypothetical protein V4582_10780 [Pseudomonadota bacterium]